MTAVLVRDALVQNPLVVGPDTTLFELIDLILGGNQTTAAVVAGDRLYGIVSAQDVLEPLLPMYVRMDANLAHVLHERFFEEALEKLRDVRVSQAMARSIETLPPDASLMEAVALMLRRGLKTVPVVEDGDRFLGSVTRRSVLAVIRRAVGG
ncbi:MAG: CBS domain-containing protein [Planctomycetes bacterium]|nr:CBS domain-containing protein [Planctomycetota bacterium]